MTQRHRFPPQQCPSVPTFPEDVREALPADWPPVPLVRITACGPLTIEVLREATLDPEGGWLVSYGPPDARHLRRKGKSTMLTLLRQLISLPNCFAARDWLTEKLRRGGHGDDNELADCGLVRVDNVVSQLRGILCPAGTPAEEQIRKHLVAYVPTSAESGGGYRLAGAPLLWLDVEALATHVRQARQLERAGQSAESAWEAAYEIGLRGRFLPEEIYSDWAARRREEVEGHLWQSVQALWRLALARQEEAGEAEALRLLQEYWLEHIEHEEALRPLLELLGKRGEYQRAEHHYAKLCAVLDEIGQEPDLRTQATMTSLREVQHQYEYRTPIPTHLEEIEKEKTNLFSENLPYAQAPTASAGQHWSFSRWWNVPYQRNPFFTGREGMLTHLHNLLHKEWEVIALSQHALCGLGGIGKTQIVLEYAYRYCYEYQAVFWIKADTRDNLVSDFLALAFQLNLPERDAQDQEVTIMAIKQWLRDQTSWLLIFDNADDLTLVRGFLPTGHQGHILLTTRAQATGQLAHRLEVEEMSLETGTLFLLRRASLIEPDAPLEKASAKDRVLAEGLVQELGGLPLALDQAGAYIEETASSLQEYFDFYHTYQLALLQRRGGLTTDHPESVATTWALAFTHIENGDPVAADLLRLCAFLDPDAIPEEILFAGLQQLAGSMSEIHQLRFHEAIGSLLRFSLVRRNGDTHTITVHRLIQSVVRDNLLPEKQAEWIHRVVHLLSEAFPPAIEVTIWPTCEKFLPHALLCAHWVELAHITSMKAASLLNTIGYYLNMKARYEMAMPLFQRALNIREQVLGEQHPDTAQTLSNLAYLYHHQDKFEEAMHFLQRSLFIRQQVLGMEHPDTATSLNALALLYRDQGRYEEAEPFFQQALAIRKQIFGIEHPQTAHSLSNLAWLYRNLGKYHEAEPLYEQSLTMRKRILGVNHPDTATSLNGLALLSAAHKNYAKAEPLFQQALTIRKQVLGTKHLHTTQSMNALALLYRDQGEYEKAELLFLEVLAIREQLLGGNHPRTVTSLHNLALLHYNQGKFEQAEPLFQRALTLREQLFGREHPRTLVILKHLTRCQKNMNK